MKNLFHFIFPILCLIVSCENNTPQDTEKFVEKSTTSDKADKGTQGDVGNSAITFLPSFKDFGDVEIAGKSPAQVITVFNSSDYPIYFGKISLTNTEAFKITKSDCAFEKSTPIESGKSCRVYIQFNPVVGGVSRGKVKLSYGLEESSNSLFGTGSDLAGSGISNLLFAGVGEITNIKGNSVQVNWTHIVGANSYFVYLIDSAGVATLQGTVVAPIETYTVTGLTKNTDYKLRVKAVDSNGVADGNKNDVGVKTLSENSPSVASVSPSAGPIGGGQAVVISGTDFVSGATAKIGSVNCSTTTYVSATQLNCLTAANSAGLYAVTVTNPDGQDGSKSAAYTYQPAPTVSTISASSGSWEGGTSVTISGTGFVAGATVTLGTVACTSPTVSNTTTISCTTGAYSAGATGGVAVDVVVTNSDGQTGTLTAGYTYKMVRIDLLAGALDPRGCRAGTDPRDARFDTPRGMATDGTYMYVSIYNSHAIYRIHLTTKAVSLFAGQPCIAGTLDGSQSTALIYNPHGMTVMGGYLYFANYQTHQIRRVDLTTGVVTTIVGNGAGNVDGVGTAARFNGIWEMTNDGTYLYTVDVSNHTVRKIDVSTNSVTTFAGSTAGNVDATGAAAKFNSPNGIVYQGGYLYVSETGNNTIRRIDVSTAAVTTYAGGTAGHLNGTGTAARFNNPRGLATDGSYLYVADLHVFRKIDLSNAYVSVLSGVYNTAAIIDGDISIARTSNTRCVFASGGYVYFGDDANTIRRIDSSTGEMSTWIGLVQNPLYAGGVNNSSTDARFNNIRSTVYDNGSIYVADYSNHVIRKIDATTQAVTTFTGVIASAGSSDGISSSARHNAPFGVAVSGNYLYVSDYNAHTIRRVHIPTQSIDTIAGAYGVSGNTDATGASARFNNPAGLSVDSSGTYLYVADLSNHRIRQIDLSSFAVTTLAGSVAGTIDGIGVAARFNQPMYLHVVSGNLYVTSNSDHRLRVIDIASANVTSINSGTAGYLDSATAWNVRFSGPRQMASDSTYLYLVEYNNHSIRKMNLSTQEVTTVTANLQPDVQSTSSNKPMWNKTGLFSADAAISWPYGISFNAATGLIVTNDYGVYRVH